jgi:hypothetical protein
MDSPTYAHFLPGVDDGPRRCGGPRAVRTVEGGTTSPSPRHINRGALQPERRRLTGRATNLLDAIEHAGLPLELAGLW